MTRPAALFLAASLLTARAATGLPPIQTVFVVMMENKSWSEIKGNPSAPYLNQTLLPMAAHCEQYFNVPNIHPSLPNYLWLEAGTNFGIFDDNEPALDHQNTTNHLVALLTQAGISWKAYQEHVGPTSLTLQTANGVACRHNPFLYFDDVTCTNDPDCPFGLAHIRPYTELQADLTNNAVARYNFIIPDDCDDMHTTCRLGNAVLQGDNWLATEVPKILASQAFQNDGVLFIVFDETDTGDAHLPFLLLSHFAKGAGYASTLSYTHSSLLRTVQEILGVGPLLGDAVNAANLSDLFLPADLSTNLQITALQPIGGLRLQLTVGGLATNLPFILQTSTDLLAWTALQTNLSAHPAYSLIVSNSMEAAFAQQFYRITQSSP